MDEIDKRYSLQPWIPWTRDWIEKGEHDLTKPRHANYKQKWKISQDAVF